MHRPCTVAILSIASLLTGQNKPVRPDNQKQLEREAFKMVRFLELDDKRAAAMARIVELGEHSIRALLMATDDPRPTVHLQAFWMLGELGSRSEAAIPRLRQSLDGDDASRSFAAFRALEKIEPEDRLWHITGDLIREIDANGAEKKQILKGKSLWDAERLPNGNMLVTVHTPSGVHEYDAKGKITWSFTDVQHPMDADRLPNGNTLIADTQGQRIIEVDRSGKIIWEFKTTDQANDAERLPSGNTLITIARKFKVIEVNTQGKVMWSMPATKIVDADRLANGNTLLTSYDEQHVREVTPDGEIVWEYKTGATPRDADRLPDGRTLVMTDSGIEIADKTGKRLKKFGAGGHEILRF